jgi:hypothetical protein
MNQTVYTLQVDVISACFEVKVNDVPLYGDKKGNPTKAEIPFSHLLVQGNNEIKVTISPAKHETEFQDHSKTDFEVYFRDIKDAKEDRKLATKIEFPDYKTNVSLKTATIPATGQFTVTLPFTQPTWASCPKLSLSTSIVEEATKIYRAYFALLQQKDVAGILKLTTVKDSDYSKAYYMTLNQQQNKISESIKEIFDEPDFKLLDFDKQTITPQLHGYAKLITLVNKDNRSPLQFYNKPEGITQSYPIYLGLVDGKMAIVL